jgi:hypothetical protein
MNPQRPISSAKRYNVGTWEYLFHTFPLCSNQNSLLAVPESVVHSEASLVFPLWLSNPAAYPMIGDLVEPQCSTCP